ncbi:MAG: tRNA (N(6)-L-threonylcarbamoyladenosine(37)-C(2))-methylthiotransferase MtaB [Sphingomonadales bacterium]|nr:tRNA (N(6)-L-threonylcarbamoyladenosine(37)-C(2))-methylthiotransferase MtaB [Sphingomonadales bacterium]PIX66524.1 MAG: tRNA (N(6)-L-threonylcarbamoyladenosine(37)-C(2))-methylthiotransferase MtaB [Sphingomonadales bacterium CG_4_10_14_3_um_filter_58_15]NCO48607.1 tRNA (N(6)-L-threonylcarbamoyladenosine(37)-C(2))-methylthiotransferase MtaB [Sphingomonadales bacterium]NCO98715.1 tRNA (N(6)-L-threonylcarbamoyladenosine(37)-C(2))-methylthiotransferase MtaB [Sphingomonadales bacterium]NCP28285.
MSALEMISMGCRLNIAESETLRQNLAANNIDGDNLIIVNSCAVTNEAVRQTRQAIRRAKKANPEKNIIVTGCAAQVDPAMFADMPETSAVVGNFDKYEAANFKLGLDSNRPDIRVSDIMRVTETAPHMVSAFADRSRAFVEIQNGCDHRCTFCIIPFGRGNSRSVPAGLVVEQVQALVDKGFQEVVLTGVDVTSYGPDLPGEPTLGMLIERILKHVPDLPRLRLSSLDGIEIDDRLFDLLTGETRMMPHVHLSLQSGDDMILKRMKRRHSREQAIVLVERLKAKRPEIAVGADIIAGFPTETDAMFANSKSIIDQCEIVHGHIFPYSPKQGTPAAKMPQVDGQVIKERARILRKTVARRANDWHRRLIGSRQRILAEMSGNTGYAENFARVRFDAPANKGQIVAVEITGVQDKQLIGRVAA